MILTGRDSIHFSPFSFPSVNRLFFHFLSSSTHRSYACLLAQLLTFLGNNKTKWRKEFQWVNQDTYREKMFVARLAFVLGMEAKETDVLDQVEKAMSRSVLSETTDGCCCLSHWLVGISFIVIDCRQILFAVTRSRSSVSFSTMRLLGDDLDCWTMIHRSITAERHKPPILPQFLSSRKKKIQMVIVLADSPDNCYGMIS